MGFVKRKVEGFGLFSVMVLVFLDFLFLWGGLISLFGWFGWLVSWCFALVLVFWGLIFFYFDLAFFGWVGLSWVWWGFFVLILRK